MRGSMSNSSVNRGMGMGGMGMGMSGGAPTTPPMMRKSSYDADARAEDFSDAGFYDDESFAGEGEAEGDDVLDEDEEGEDADRDGGIGRGEGERALYA